MIVYDSEQDSYKIVQNPYVDLFIGTSTVTLIGESRVYDFPKISVSDLEDGLIIHSSSLPQLFSFSMNSNRIIENLVEIEMEEYMPLSDRMLELNGEEAYQNFKNEDEKRMKFFSPKWDESSRLFYRLGYRKNNIGDDYQNYLFIYDSSLRLVKKSCIVGFKARPREFYLVNSTAYVAVEFYDDLGFASFDIRSL